MPYAFVPILFIFLSLGVIIIIVINKFPQLSALDVSSLPHIKEAKVKEAIKYQKFHRTFKKLITKAKPINKFFKNFWQDTQARFRRLMQSAHDKYQQISAVAAETEAATSGPAPKLETGQLLAEADKLAAASDLERAEANYLAIIKINPKVVEAYRGLGRIYFDQGKAKQAKEVYEFILKLSPDDDRAYNRLGRLAENASDWELAAKYFEVAVRLNNRRAIRFFDLGRAYKALNKPAAALRNFSKAVQLESNNAKYLDQLLEMSIIAGDSELAKETYDRLRLANPENQKLVEFKQRIDEM